MLRQTDEPAATDEPTLNRVICMYIYFIFYKYI